MTWWSLVRHVPWVPKPGAQQRVNWWHLVTLWLHARSSSMVTTGHSMCLIHDSWFNSAKYYRLLSFYCTRLCLRFVYIPVSIIFLSLLRCENMYAHRTRTWLPDTGVSALGGSINHRSSGNVKPVNPWSCLWPLLTTLKVFAALRGSSASGGGGLREVALGSKTHLFGNEWQHQATKAMAKAMAKWLISLPFPLFSASFLSYQRPSKSDSLGCKCHP